MERQILSVGQFNEYVKYKMEADSRLRNVAVQGEISNYKMYPSGHHYFSLKDETGILKCVMFRSSASKLRFRPENGMKVVALGAVNVFLRDGVYQLNCTALMMDGMGELNAAFEQLKRKLEAEGLFDKAHKKPLPTYPGIIGIISSEAGDAVHDILRILRQRYPLTQVRFLPVRVQGAEAPAEVAGAIAYANRYRLADVLIVGRGGGSTEELWAFNDERIARAIYQSQIPVISAVGHEPDFYISDFVADVRAATPSNAAEIVVPDQNALRQQLDSIEQAMIRSVSRHIGRCQDRLATLSSRPVLRSPLASFEQRRRTVTLMQTKLNSAQNQLLAGYRHRFVAQTAKLDALSPLKVLTRGYAMAITEDGRIVRKTQDVHPGDVMNVQVSDGVIRAQVQQGEQEHE